MQDVGVRTRLAHPLDDAVDGDILGLGRAGRFELAVTAACTGRMRLDHAGIFGVHDEAAADFGDLGEGDLELLAIQVTEFVDPGGRQKTFESEDSRVV